MTIGGHTTDDVQRAGAQADAGSFVCVGCSLPLSLDHAEAMPICPGCGGEKFKRASLFEQPTLGNLRAIGPSRAPSDWLDGVRERLAAGKYLAFWAEGRARVLELAEGWSRIGRSGSADIRLDDPTVSRRHAVVVRTPEGELRALDDRSRNGIAVNGDRVEWSPLADGDRLQIGRYTLHVVEAEGSPA